jgi:hypothetical protein
MKKQLAVDFCRAFSFFACPLGEQTEEENNNDHGNRNLPPTDRLPLRPISVPSGWGSARLIDSRLPSSLTDWLASKDALIIY